MGPWCALCSGWRIVGWGGEDAQRLFPPVGAQVGAGGLLLGVSSWTAELVQHGLIPEGRAEGEGQRPPTTRRLCPASCTPGNSEVPNAARGGCASVQTPPPARSPPTSSTAAPWSPQQAPPRGSTIYSALTFVTITVNPPEPCRPLRSGQQGRTSSIHPRCAELHAVNIFG